MPNLEAKDGGELRQRGRKRHSAPRIPKDHSENEASLVAQMMKNLPAKAGDPGSICGLGRSPGEGNGKPAPVFLPGEFHGQRSLLGYIQSQSQTQLSKSH